MEAGQGMSLINIIVPFTIVLFIIAVGVVLLYQHFQKNLYQHELDKATLKSVQQEELLRNSILIQEEERKRIAADLHDELGAAISIIRMNLVLIKQKESALPFSSPETSSTIQHLISLSESAISSVRNISHQLMPPQLESFGLIKTLDSFIMSINQSEKINICLFVKCELPDLQWPITLGLYRIILELINNTIKHAEASNILLEFDYNTHYLLFTFKDNGKGLDFTSEAKKGMGFKSIEARVHALRGRFVYENNAGDTGFKAFIELPIQE